MNRQVNQALEKSLNALLRARFGPKFIEPNWKARHFGFYTDNVDVPKMAVLEATENVAASLNLQLSRDTLKHLQTHVSLRSTPNDVLVVMSAAIDVAQQMQELPRSRPN